MRLVHSILLLVVAFLFYEVAASPQGISVNFGTYRPPAFRRRERRSALFPNTFNKAPTPPSKLCPCSSSPCQHFGECKNTRELFVDGSFELGFVCSCVRDWTGESCNICDASVKETICEDSCFGFNHNDECNDGGTGHVTSDCPIGTDCSDCSARCVRIVPQVTTEAQTTEPVVTIQSTTAFYRCGHTYTKPGIIFSINFPERYENYIDCDILIVAPTGNQVVLIFLAFDVENHSSCNWDYLAVYDGNGPSSPLFGYYCGTTIPSSFASSGESIFLQFHTDFCCTRTGWFAVFSFADCPDGYSLYGDMCYRVQTSPSMSYYNAQSACAAEGATLVSIHSQESDAFFQSQAAAAGMFLWMGFNDLASEGTFTWEDGSTVDYVNWFGANPDNSFGSEDCAHFYNGWLGWNDWSCGNSIGFICSISIDITTEFQEEIDMMNQDMLNMNQDETQWVTKPYTE